MQPTVKWHCREAPSPQIDALSRSLGISRAFATILAKKGFDDEEEVEEFLYPKLAQLEDPFEVTHLKEAVARLRVAMEKQESICVMGDYDVDGVTSTVLLISILNYFGCSPRYFVPRRLDEGYGLSEQAVARLLDEGPIDLLFVLDSGTNAVSEIEFLRSKGIDVVIVDHHRSKDETPSDCILINPHVYDQDATHWRHLCTVGLVFKFVHALVKEMRHEGIDAAAKLQLKDYLDLVAMGTIADLMPLKFENRILSKFGLRKLSNSLRPGIRALLEVCKVNSGQALKPVDVSFKLGPRINASGRIADASLPIEMLLSEDYSRCMEIANELNDMNRERQDIERDITKESEDMLLENGNMDSPGIILYGSEWHSGVVGIVAGRLSRKYHRPAIVLAQDGEFAKGSGRSVHGVNLVEILKSCDDLLESWGGHPMAIGISLKVSDLEAFKTRFQETLDKSLGNKSIERVIDIEYWVRPQEITPAFLDELELLQPFGEANPEPIFGIKRAVLVHPPDIFGDNHYRFQIEAEPGSVISGVAWKKADDLPPAGTPINIAGKLTRNHWNGREFLQIELIDWKRL